MKPNGAIVVVAKCPIAGKSKTRLSKPSSSSHPPLVSPEGAALLAKAMLSDILTTLSSASSKYKYLNNTIKVLLYAPGDEFGETIMMEILQEIQLSFISSTALVNDEENAAVVLDSAMQQQEQHDWILLPMMMDSGGGLQSSDLGAKLADALHRVRALLSNISSSLKPKSRQQQLTSRIITAAAASDDDEDEDCGVVVAVTKDDGSTAWGSTVSDVGSSCNTSISDVEKEEKDGTKKVGGGATIKHSNFDNDNNDDHHQGGVLFLGMDSPELPLEEIIYALTIAQHPSSSSSSSSLKGKAHLCPANDGGYGMLCIPSSSSSSSQNNAITTTTNTNPCRIFNNGIRWSNSLTAISQLKALTDEGIEVSIGKLMHDVDEAEDVRALAERLCSCRNHHLRHHRRRHGKTKKKKKINDVLECNAPGATLLALSQQQSCNINENDDEKDDDDVTMMMVKCPYTWDALMKLELVQKKIHYQHHHDDNDDSNVSFVVNTSKFEKKESLGDDKAKHY